jgi:hypothetical protein
VRVGSGSESAFYRSRRVGEGVPKVVELGRWPLVPGGGGVEWGLFQKVRGRVGGVGSITATRWGRGRGA